MANYCRSPVAEYLFKEKFPSFDFYSAGLAPLAKSEMDPKSAHFLSSKKINFHIHNPKKITLDMVEKCDLILAMDTTVLINLNNMFKKFSSKIMLFNHQQPKKHIRDPYRMPDKEYREVMEKIYDIVADFELQ